MKEIIKYALIGLAITVFYWIWISLIPSVLTSLSWGVAIVAGTGSFLSFELAVLTGVIISKIKHQ